MNILRLRFLAQHPLHTEPPSCSTSTADTPRALTRLLSADLANPKTNWNKTPGYTEAETSAYARVLNAEGTADEDAPRFVDVWRARNPALRHYTYFSYRFNCREKGIGWRLDMCACFLLTLLFYDCPSPAVSSLRGRVRRGAIANITGWEVWSVRGPEGWLTFLFRAQSW